MMTAYLRAALISFFLGGLPLSAGNPYPETGELRKSPGGLTYFVNPVTGNDGSKGTTRTSAWKTFAPVNGLMLAAGDCVMIEPGLHEVSLTPRAAGTEKRPVMIRFQPGVHEFAVEQALRRPWHISNACDAPTVPKPMGILIENSQNLILDGRSALGKERSLLLMGGRMIEFVNNHSQNISWRNLAFDLKRPTVSELRVIESAPGSSVIQIADGSTYSFKDGKFEWTGDLGSGDLLIQQGIPAEGRCWRVGEDKNPFTLAQSIADLGNGKFRLDFKDDYQLMSGHQFQFRYILRDSVGGFNQRSKNISFIDCNFHALTNMGIVSQFCENLTFERVQVVPPPNSLRTCPAWADILHFSGCKGRILVENCRFSGSQDDPINVHGTHLRIMGKLAKNQLHLRFAHPQTYGFAAFAPGDEIAVIRHTNLCEIPNNPRRKVIAVERITEDGKDWSITLDGPAPDFDSKDVVDNITWYPQFIARNNYVDMSSCRGFVVKTRKTSVIEGNTFHNCTMPGLLIEDDARGWFESGPTRDLTIRNNNFLNCGILIGSRTTTPEIPVHENIRVLDNHFANAGIRASGVRGLTLRGNRFSGSVTINTSHCVNVRNENNVAKPASQSPRE